MRAHSDSPMVGGRGDLVTLAVRAGTKRARHRTMSERTLNGLLALIEGAAALLSRTGRVVAMNPEARDITEATSYFMLRRDKRLVFREPSDDEAYVKALAQALHGPRVRLSAFSVAGAPSATAVVIPFVPHTVHEPDPHALIVIRQASYRGAPVHLFQVLFGLTGAESEVANAVALGMSVARAAQTLGITRTTARNQLSAAMTKMSVHRQAELVAKIVALAPRLRLSEK